MTTASNVAILGAGVAGTSAAIALASRGYDVSIYERRKSPSTLGAGVVCWPNATFILDELGVLDSLLPRAGQPTAMHRYDHRGQSLGRIDVRALNQRMGFPSISVLRVDLMRALHEGLAALSVPTCYGSEVTHIAPEAGGRTTVHIKGRDSLTADIVLGADGRMRSPARAFVLGDATPTYQHVVNWIGVFECAQAVFPSMEIHDYWGCEQRFGFVPLDSRRAYWAGARAAPAIADKVPAAYRCELLELFAGWPGPVRKIIEDTPLDAMNKIYLHDHDPISRWHRDNVLLIGDAAHAPLPTSGQGACQALEDAWHLANILENQPGDLPAAFTRFTALRADKTARITAAGRQLSRSLFAGSATESAQRDEQARHADYAALGRGIASLWASGLPMKNDNGQ